jgi:hypothetical protein
MVHLSHELLDEAQSLSIESGLDDSQSESNPKSKIEEIFAAVDTDNIRNELITSESASISFVGSSLIMLTQFTNPIQNEKIN